MIFIEVELRICNWGYDICNLYTQNRYYARVIIYIIAEYDFMNTCPAVQEKDRNELL